MVPVIPLVLTAAGAGLVAYEALRKKTPAAGTPGATPGAPGTTPGQPGTPSSPGGAPTMPADLRAAYNQLLAADNVDPDQLEALAAQLAQYGFAAEAAKLRAKAAEIRARRAAPQPGSLPVVPPPVPSMPSIPSMPSVPSNVGQTALVTTSSDPLTLRDAPNGNAVGSLPKGATVTVLNWNGGAATSNAPQGWAMVTYGGSAGYASKQYLQLGGSAVPQPSPAPAPAPGPATAQMARVTTSSDPLTLRSGPNGGAIGSLPKGAMVYVINWNGGAPTSNSSQGWAEVSFEGLNGYASKNYLSLQQVATSGVGKATEGSGRPVTCLAPEGVRIRATPSPNGKALAVLPNGETATLLRHVSGAKGNAGSPGPGGWCLVRWANFQGWVPSEWMRLS